MLALLPAVSALAGREVYDIGRGWKFYTVDRRDSVGVTLPHTWNDTDAAVGRLDYYRGIGNYFRYLKARPEWRGKRVFVRFYGAGTVAALMVNGRHAGEHRGGNNAFEFEITDLLDYGGKNLLWVIVNNGARLDVLPTAGEENVYGGLFRQAEIIVTEPAAIGFDGYGGCGVLFATERADTLRASGSAAVTVNVPDSRHVQLDMRILDARDSVVFSGHAKHRADRGPVGGGAAVRDRAAAPVAGNRRPLSLYRHSRPRRRDAYRFGIVPHGAAHFFGGCRPRILSERYLLPPARSGAVARPGLQRAGLQRRGAAPGYEAYP